MVVHVGNLALVTQELRIAVYVEPGGRIVGMMGVVVVKPQEETLVSMRLEPIQPAGRDGVRAALDGAELVLLESLAHVIIIEIEALIELELFVQDVRRDHGAGGESLFFQEFGQGDVLLGQEKPAVDAYPVVQGIEPRHHRRVGRQRQGHGRNRFLKNGGVRGKGVQVGGEPGFVPVAAELIGPSRVEGDEEDVEIVPGDLGSLGATRQAGQGQGRAQRRNEGLPVSRHSAPPSGRRCCRFAVPLWSVG